MFHLGWFLGSGFSVQTWAMDPWAGNTGHDWMKGDLFVDLAASLERARFDYLLVEDTSMVEDAYGRSMETTLKYGLLAPKCDPVPLIPLLTQRTKHIGIAVTLSTSFYHPYMAARTMTTLDHLTDGRVGLNVVTGSSTRAAQQYGYDELMLHADRYGWQESGWKQLVPCGIRGTRARCWWTRRHRGMPITRRCTRSTSRASTSVPGARSTPSPARNGDR